jgi:hypothetical protein
MTFISLPTFRRAGACPGAKVAIAVIAIFNLLRARREVQPGFLRGRIIHRPTSQRSSLRNLVCWRRTCEFPEVADGRCQLWPSPVVSPQVPIEPRRGGLVPRCTPPSGEGRCGDDLAGLAEQNAQLRTGMCRTNMGQDLHPAMILARPTPPLRPRRCAPSVRTPPLELSGSVPQNTHHAKGKHRSRRYELKHAGHVQT